MFMASYRASFPGISITPKLHILEEHVVPWIRIWRFGLGFVVLIVPQKITATPMIYQTKGEKLH